MSDYDPETSLFPTHSCFDDALEFIDYAIKDHPEIEAMLLVHAICVANGTDREYAHAWVEDTTLGLVITCGIYQGRKTYFYSKKEAFYETYQVKETTKYSVVEALENNLRHHNFGPWEDKYIALCGDQMITIGVAGQLDLAPIGSIPMKGK